MMRLIAQPDPKETGVYPHGNGASFSVHAERRTVQGIAGKALTAFELRNYDSPLEHPKVAKLVRTTAAPFRRVGRRYLGHWYDSGGESL